MRQFELISPKKIIKKEVPIPETKANQVKIKVKAIGICGSDIHAYYGKHPFMSFPIVLGHECSGVVEETAEGVENVAVGDRVVLRPQLTCGKCRPCREGRYNVCENLKVLGCQTTGGCSDYYTADAGLFYRIPDVLGFDEGTMIEPLAVAVHAVLRAGSVKDKNVLVLGAGTIGNLTAQSAKGLGAKTAMITDIADEKLKLAEACGIDYPVNTAKKDLKAAIEEKYGSDGIDIVYECTANANALNQVLSVAGKGTPVVIVGVYGGMTNINLANVQDREYSLIGTLMYTEDDYYRSIRLIEQRDIQLKPLISKEFSIDQVNEAYQYIEDNQSSVQKVILNV
mgnify:CR=1 FL=1